MKTNDVSNISVINNSRIPVSSEEARLGRIEKIVNGVALLAISAVAAAATAGCCLIALPFAPIPLSIAIVFAIIGVAYMIINCRAHTQAVKGDQPAIVFKEGQVLVQKEFNVAALIEQAEDERVDCQYGEKTYRIHSNFVKDFYRGWKINDIVIDKVPENNNDCMPAMKALADAKILDLPDFAEKITLFNQSLYSLIIKQFVNQYDNEYGLLQKSNQNTLIFSNGKAVMNCRLESQISNLAFIEKVLGYVEATIEGDLLDSNGVITFTLKVIPPPS